MLRASRWTLGTAAISATTMILFLAEVGLSRSFSSVPVPTATKVARYLYCKGRGGVSALNQGLFKHQEEEEGRSRDEGLR